MCYKIQSWALHLTETDSTDNHKQEICFSRENGVVMQDCSPDNSTAQHSTAQHNGPALHLKDSMAQHSTLYLAFKVQQGNTAQNSKSKHSMAQHSKHGRAQRSKAQQRRALPLTLT
jgi:hypothetical protein